MCVELCYEIGQYLQPKSLCYLYQATGNIGFRGNGLLKYTIIQHIVQITAQAGQCHYNGPIVIGTKESPCLVPTYSQADLLKAKLNKFIKGQAYELEELKLIYRDLINHIETIQNYIMPGFFENANGSAQKRAIIAIAKLSNESMALAEFLIAFTRYCNININVQDVIQTYALQELIYQWHNSVDKQKKYLIQSQISFLLNQGANPTLLTPQEKLILEKIHSVKKLSELTVYPEGIGG